MATTYVVRFHYSENARETMQEKINRMLANEVRRAEFREQSSV
ncbi:transposon-encoded TnpW family protein [Lactonifactor longoviformis]